VLHVRRSAPVRAGAGRHAGQSRRTASPSKHLSHRTPSALSWPAPRGLTRLGPDQSRSIVCRRGSNKALRSIPGARSAHGSSRRAVSTEPENDAIPGAAGASRFSGAVDAGFVPWVFVAKGLTYVSKTNDHSRRLFADFVAERLKARRSAKDDSVEPGQKARARAEEVTDRSSIHDGTRGSGKGS
jgi:hypothetical protein